MRKNGRELFFVFAFGGVAYGLCEILWRGYTHPSMFLLGGICFAGLYEGQKKYRSLPFYLRCICGGIYITCLELVFGIVVNVALGMNVWDYSSMPFNFMGQICLRFFCLWVALCLPALFLCDNISKFFDGI